MKFREQDKLYKNRNQFEVQLIVWKKLVAYHHLSNLITSSFIDVFSIFIRLSIFDYFFVCNVVSLKFCASELMQYKVKLSI